MRCTRCYADDFGNPSAFGSLAPPSRGVGFLTGRDLGSLCCAARAGKTLEATASSVNAAAASSGACGISALVLYLRKTMGDRARGRLAAVAGEKRSSVVRWLAGLGPCVST